MSEDPRPGSKAFSGRANQIVPKRNSKELSNGNIGDRRSSYNMDQYERVGVIDEMKEEEQIEELNQMSPLDKFVIFLVIIYTLLVFINFSFTSNQADENSDIELTLYIAQVIELVILICFIFEIIARVFINGFKEYFSDLWQIFDAIVIVASIVLIILDWVLNQKTFQTVSKVLRGIFRFLRLFLVFRKFNQVKSINNAGQRYKVRSPVVKVIDILRDLADTFEDPDIITQLNQAVSHISNNTLYDPIFTKGSKQNEILNQWRGVQIQEAQDIVTNSESIVTFTDNVKIPIDLSKDWDENILNLDYDYFSLYKKIDLSMLVHLLNYYFQKHQLFSQLKINPESFGKVAESIAQGYHPTNPYHNVIHAFDVTHTIYFFMNKCEFSDVGKLQPIDIAIMILAAASHDVDHPGLNNLFLSNNREALALRYNDKSPLEQHHSATLFTIIKDNDLLKHFSTADYKYFREKAVSMILSTDNAVHGRDYGKLKARLQSPDFDPKSKDKGICMDALLHAADISNPFKPIINYTQWTERVLNEFWLQGDKEKELGLPISMLCDRKTTNTAKAQIGFIDFMVIPYYQTICQFLPILNQYTEQLTENKKYWAEKIDYYQEILNNMT